MAESAQQLLTAVRLSIGEQVQRGANQLTQALRRHSAELSLEVDGISGFASGLIAEQKLREWHEDEVVPELRDLQALLPPLLVDRGIKNEIEKEIENVVICPSNCEAFSTCRCLLMLCCGPFSFHIADQSAPLSHLRVLWPGHVGECGEQPHGRGGGGARRVRLNAQFAPRGNRGCDAVAAVDAHRADECA